MGCSPPATLSMELNHLKYNLCTVFQNFSHTQGVLFTQPVRQARAPYRPPTSPASPILYLFWPG